jgi:hypothetical protein
MGRADSGGVRAIIQPVQRSTIPSNEGVHSNPSLRQEKYVEVRPPPSSGCPHDHTTPQRLPGLAFGSARTEGTVVKLEPEVDFISHGTPQAGEIVWLEQVVVFYPVLEYQVDDRKYTYRPRSAFRTYKVGETVAVLYKVDRPGAARIDTFSDRWLVPLLLGGALVLLGALFMVARPCPGGCFGSSKPP